MLKSLLAGVLTTALGFTVSAQSVIFPQEAQPGTAKLVENDNSFVLSNNLLNASFMNEDGKIIFGGCPEMDLNSGSELFTITLANGKSIPASEMTLNNVEAVALSGDPEAARGSERINGQAIEASFSTSDLDVTWRAVLRDGSHYLRTELEITPNGNKNVDMNSITPMIYDVLTSEGVTAPEVVGNTRGAILASNKIFAGVESPMGINSVGSVDNMNDFTPRSWTPTSFSWSPGAQTPQGILNLGFTSAYIVGTKGYLEFKEAGPQTVTFTYSSGNHRLNMVGVDVLNKAGDTVVSYDYHIGYTGNNKDKNVYNIDIPEPGVYIVRFFIETRTETIESSGNITYSKPVAIPSSSSDGNSTPIVGRWSRKTTLQAGKTWKISSVVGLIAPEQARRSVLAYSERERAVPWRPFSIYNSWYELNINRNNSPTYSNHFTSDECVAVLEQWKTNLFDKYEEAHIESFVWDDGWDKYGTWDFNPNFPKGFSDIDAKAQEMNSSIGTWLGPVGGYGVSGDLRRKYWTDRGQEMKLSNPDYYDVFLSACTRMLTDYQFNFFKFDGISALPIATGPDTSATGEESAEAIINLESEVRKIKPDVFLNTTVGTWASPFWYRFSDTTWRQEQDFGTAGYAGTDRERWITYRDQLVYQHYVQNSPLCPINTLMTHGVILSRNGDVAKTMDYESVLRELRCAYACGSGMVELYCDSYLLNTIEGGKLWGDIAECIAWQKKNAEVLPDIHWVGGAPYANYTNNVYGWASWNGKNCTLALRNPASSTKSFTFKLRNVLEIPAYINGEITLSKAFNHHQDDLSGLDVDTPINIDDNITVSLPANSVFVFDGVDPNYEGASAITDIKDDMNAEDDVVPFVKGTFDLAGRRVENPAKGFYIVDGKKTFIN